MKILVTGGLGFIGSHTAVELVKNGHEVIIADNLVNSKIEVHARINEITGSEIEFHEVDVTDEESLDKIFGTNDLDGVIHFAGLKAVGESVSDPLGYYYNNLVSTMIVSGMCIKYGVSRFVFSSSATVYGDQPSPLREDMELGKTTNPYGETKAMSERILADTAYANKGFSVSLLRYFNPVGAHESGLIGEDPNGIPNNLMPFVTRVARGQLEKLSIFGNDYDTIDGTGVRDYIHVVDLAKGHVKAIDYIFSNPGLDVINLGTGVGYSVLDMVKAFGKACGKEIPYEIKPRRGGDIAMCYADPAKAAKVLVWIAEKGLDEMCADTWRWQSQNPNGYEA